MCGSSSEPNEAHHECTDSRHVAAGGDKKNQPTNFLRLNQTQALISGASEEAALGYVEQYGDLADGTVVVNARALFDLVWHTQQAIDTAACSIAAIQRIERRSGMKLALRQERSKYADPDFHKHDSLITEVIDRMAAS